MKQIIMTVLCCMVAIYIYAQAPAAVEKAFRTKFPDASAVKWEKESKTEYEASFILKGKKSSASYTPSGEWLESEVAIDEAELPAAVKAAFAKQQPGVKATTVYRIESAKKEMYFEIEYSVKGKTKELKFDANGKTR
jgi:hypothetical protein